MPAAAPDLVQPAYLHVPERFAFTHGDRAADTAALAGLTLDPEQRLVLDALKAVDERGRYPLELALVVARQNMKTLLLEVLALDDLFNDRDRLVIWTAHLFDTSAEAFRDMDELIGASDWLRRRVLRATRGNGDEGFELKNGSRLKFKARSKTSGRGLAGDKVNLDEAFALTAPMLGALLPTLSSRPNPQARYMSSAGLAESDALRAVRDRGRAGTDPSLVYVEYCADDGDCATSDCAHLFGTPGCLLDDEALWLAANPSLNSTRANSLTLEKLRAERRAMPPEEFARERLGWWDAPAGASMMPFVEAWMRGDSADAPLDPVTFGVDVAPNGAAAAVVAASGGVVEMVEHRPGTTWLPDRLHQLVRDHHPYGIWLDATGPAGMLLPELERVGVAVSLVTGGDSAKACGLFWSAVVDKTVGHRHSPAMDAAVVGATRRTAGDAWRWNRRDSTVDISPLVAATLAYWGSAGQADYAVTDSIF